MEKINFPADKFLKFLGSYGPSTGGKSLFDEAVAKAAKQYEIREFALKGDFVDQIVTLLKSDKPVSVLIAGIAGDGKSFHCRQVWNELFPGRETEWTKAAADPRASLTTVSGNTRTIQFVRDLTAIEDPATFADLLRQIDESQSDTQMPLHSVVMACNHGAILDRLRKAGRNDLADKIEDQFFSPKDQSGKHLQIFDLSKTRQEVKFKDLVKCVCTHEGWSKCESACRCAGECRILKNRNLLWNQEKQEATVTTTRLSELVRLAGMDGVHFPIRELYLLIANAIIGCPAEMKRMADCELMADLINNGRSESIGLFKNLLGDNLSRRLRSGKLHIFDELARFNIGREPSRDFDDIILDGLYSQIPNKREANAEYLPESVKNASGTIKTDAIQEARRQLFFSWLDNQSMSCWQLTAYRHSHEYLRMLGDLSAYGGEDNLPEGLKQGLNRVFTGTAINAEKIVLATDCASTKTSVGSIIAADIDPDDVKIQYDINCPIVPPNIHIEGKGGTFDFPLTPRKYECLMAFADGTVFTGFAKDCISEFFSWKSRLIHAAEEQKDLKASFVIKEINNSKITIRDIEKAQK